MSNIKDRGGKKWRGLILPEHATLIEKWQEEANQVEYPELEEWELTLIAEEINRAYKSKATIKVTYWRSGYLKDDYGEVISIDNKSKSIVIDDPFGTARYPFDEIVAVTIID